MYHIVHGIQLQRWIVHVDPKGRSASDIQLRFMHALKIIADGTNYRHIENVARMKSIQNKDK